MNFKTIWDLMNTRQAYITYFAVFLLLVFCYQMLKNKRIKLLMTDEKFINAKLFRSTLTMPIAISPEGYVGIVRGPFLQSIMVPMRHIKGFELLFDGHSIVKKLDSAKDELVFTDLASMMEIHKHEKTQKINLVLYLNKKIENCVLDVSLYGTSKLSSAVHEKVRVEIKELFLTLEEVEKSIKKSKGSD